MKIIFMLLMCIGIVSCNSDGGGGDSSSIATSFVDETVIDKVHEDAREQEQKESIAHINESVEQSEHSLKEEELSELVSEGFLSKEDEAELLALVNKESN